MPPHWWETILLPTTDICGFDSDRRGILCTEALRGHIQSNHSTFVFFEISRDFMCGRTVGIDQGFTGEHHHVPVAGFIGVEMQGYARMSLDMFDLMGIGFAEDQKGVSLPNEPDGTWLRNEIRIYGCQPDDIFLIQMLFDCSSKFCGEIDHG